ncbi:SulP family inorganic anion transporter [sulfur-oxidizing endosymbiont of Gigantopelta aegis]|uniref:SulP family inorganic anion transporter n=1 Tax=sulfur-oxidizing endosymbiont of Gigantopelta aegis TaxID=2794934 RepID=UPI0018DB0E8E|nr:SulP family inorganic anion transporter [sulfur-oxidizing endosymbiont of Gigantopelta aegis]
MIFFNGLHFNNIKGDIYGGLTAAVVALPLAMGMGVTSGAGPMAGIYGAIFVGFFAAIFGGTPAQVSGPTGPMTVVMAVIFVQYTSMFPNDLSHGMALAFTVVIFGGAFQILFGLLKIGRFISLIPHPVVSGFMSGIGVIIILLQLQPLFGQVALSTPLGALIQFPQTLHEPVWLAVILSTMTLAIVYGLPKKITVIIPAPLVALVGGTLVLYFLSNGQIELLKQGDSSTYLMSGVSIIGDIPSGFPGLIFPTIELNLLVDMIKSGLILGALGSIDSLLTSLVADNMTRTYHKPNQELIGQGIGNMVAGAFGGLPGAGATMRTVVNVRAGGMTPISGALHALVLLAIVLGLGSLALFIPKAVLAGILIKVGTDIIDWDYLKQIRHSPIAGVMMMLTVFFLTVFVDLIEAVAIGMVMASFVFMHRMTDLQVKSMHIIRSKEDDESLSDEEAELLDKAKGKILIYKLSGPRSFTSAKNMVQKLSEYTDYDSLILDMHEMTAIDYTSCKAIDEILEGLKLADHQAYITGASLEVNETLEKLKAKRYLKKGHEFNDRTKAICAALAK